MRSLQIVLNCSPGRLYPGHGPYVESGCIKLREYIQHRETRIEQILCALRAEGNRRVTASHLTRTIYSDTPENLIPAAQHNVTVVLQKLFADGVVTCSHLDDLKRAEFSVIVHPKL